MSFRRPKGGRISYTYTWMHFRSFVAKAPLDDKKICLPVDNGKDTTLQLRLSSIWATIFKRFGTFFRAPKSFLQSLEPFPRNHIRISSTPQFLNCFKPESQVR